MEETWMSLTNISQQMKLNHIHIQLTIWTKGGFKRGLKRRERIPI